MTSGSALRAALAVASVTVLLLSGCTGDDDTPAGEPPAVETPTPEAVVTSRPAAQFPGGCEDLLPDSIRKVMSYESTTAPDFGLANPFTEAVDEQGGALFCGWESPHSAIYLTVLRNADSVANLVSEFPRAAGADLDTLGGDTSELSCAGDDRYWSCTGAALVGDYLVRSSASLTPYIANEPDVRDQFTRMLKPVVATLVATPEPPVWTAPTGSWPLLLDCEAIETGGGVAAALGNPLLKAVRSMSAEEGEVPSEEVDAIGGGTFCRWFEETESPDGAVTYFEVTALAGGAWYWGAPVAHTEETVEVIEIEGTDDAAVRCFKGTCSLDARIGSNAFQIRGLRDSSYESPLTKEVLVAAAPAVIAGITAAAG